MKKPMKIELAPGALDNIPEEQREALMDEIREAFKDFDPEEPPGKPVRGLEPGTTHCPLCGTEFGKGHLTKLPDGNVVFIDCRGCDETFAYEVQ